MEFSEDTIIAGECLLIGKLQASINDDTLTPSHLLEKYPSVQGEGVSEEECKQSFNFWKDGEQQRGKAGKPR